MKKTHKKIEKCLAANPEMYDWQIAEETKVPRATVRRFLLKNNLSNLLQRKPSVTANSSKLVDYLSKPENQNKKSWQVADETKLSHATIQRYARSHPTTIIVERRIRTVFPNIPNAIPHEKRIAIYELFKNHPETKVATIARENGVTRQAIDQLIRTMDEKTGLNVHDLSRKNKIPSKPKQSQVKK